MKWLGLILVLLAAWPAMAQTGASDPKAADMDSPAVRRCLKETEAPALRECVRRLAGLVNNGDELDRLERNIMKSCLAKDDAALRECAVTFAGRGDKARIERADDWGKALRTWQSRGTASRMDDSATVILELESDDEVANSVGTLFRPSLMVRCKENSTAVIVFSDGWFLDDQVPVAWRLDKEKPQAASWQRSDSRKAAGLWDGGRAVPFIKAMLGKDALIMRVTPYQSAPKEMSFNIAGLDVAIEPLRKACKW